MEITTFSGTAQGNVTLIPYEGNYNVKLEGENKGKYTFELTDEEENVYNFEYHFDKKQKTVVLNKTD